MVEATLAAKVRAAELMNEDGFNLWSPKDYGRYQGYSGVADYIQKVSDIAEGASQSVVSDARRWELLSSIVVEADVDPLAEQLWLAGEWVGKEGFARIVREAVDMAGLQIVPK